MDVILALAADGERAAFAKDVHRPGVEAEESVRDEDRRVLSDRAAAPRERARTFLDERRAAGHAPAGVGDRLVLRRCHAQDAGRLSLVGEFRRVTVAVGADVSDFERVAVKVDFHTSGDCDRLGRPIFIRSQVIVRRNRTVRSREKFKGAGADDGRAIDIRSTTLRNAVETKCIGASRFKRHVAHDVPETAVACEQRSFFKFIRDVAADHGKTKAHSVGVVGPTRRILTGERIKPRCLRRNGLFNIRSTVGKALFHLDEYEIVVRIRQEWIPRRIAKFRDTGSAGSRPTSH